MGVRRIHARLPRPTALGQVAPTRGRLRATTIKAEGRDLPLEMVNIPATRWVASFRKEASVRSPTSIVAARR